MQNENNEMTSEVPQAEITDSQLGSGAYGKNVENNQEKKSLAVRVKERVKNHVTNYMHNLDPRGKDKFWWAGNLANVGASAFLLAAAPALLPLKTLTNITARVGVSTVEKGIEKHKKKLLGKEAVVEKIAKMQEAHPKGTRRIKNFVLGASNPLGLAFR